MEDEKIKEMMIVIVLGFLCLGMSLLTCMSIKSSLGILSVVHNHLIIFGTISILLGLSAIYADRKLFHVKV